MVWLSPHLW
jgi:hypothetical protein